MRDNDEEELVSVGNATLSYTSKKPAAVRIPYCRAPPHLKIQLESLYRGTHPIRLTAATEQPAHMRFRAPRSPMDAVTHLHSQITSHTLSSVGHAADLTRPRSTR